MVLYSLASSLEGFSDLEVKVVEDRENVLLNRRELVLEINHPGEGTPTRIDVRKYVAAKYNVELDRVYVIKLDTKTGTNKTIGYVRIYDTVEDSLIEPEYIRLRNRPKAEEGGEEVGEEA